MGNRKAQKILFSFLLAFLFISGHSFASDYSGVWVGKTMPHGPECGFSESFKLLVRGENFEAISKDVTGARSLSGKIENGKIKQSINWGMTIDRENQDANEAKLIGGFIDEEKFVGEISAYGYRIEFDREFPVACSLDIVLAPENVVNAKKKIIKKEDPDLDKKLESITGLYERKLISKDEYETIRKKLLGLD